MIWKRDDTHEEIVFDDFASTRHDSFRLSQFIVLRQRQSLAQDNVDTELLQSPHDFIVNFLLVERQEAISGVNDSDTLLLRWSTGFREVMSVFGVVVQVGNISSVLDTESSSTSDQNRRCG